MILFQFGIKTKFKFGPKKSELMDVGNFRRVELCFLLISLFEMMNAGEAF